MLTDSICSYSEFVAHVQVALVEADQSRDQTETRNKILEGQVLSGTHCKSTL